MLRSELMSWPVTLAILVLAFGSLVAAGLPLMLTVIGLTAAAGSLYLASRLADVSIWAMNFALMFALALGIDYALFIVVRYRMALRRQPHDAGDAVAETMDTAGKAVMFSGLTVLISLSAVLLVPSPAFRSTALGIMLADVFVLAATLTLLPAVLVRLGARVSIAVLVVGLGSLAFRLVPLVAARRVPARLSTVAGWAGVAVLAAYTPCGPSCSTTIRRCRPHRWSRRSPWARGWWSPYAAARSCSRSAPAPRSIWPSKAS